LIPTIDSEGDCSATNLDAPNQRELVASAAKPTPENWQELIPEQSILRISKGAGYPFANYSYRCHVYKSNTITAESCCGISRVAGYYSVAVLAVKKRLSSCITLCHYTTPSSIYALPG
jgi:prolyl oligopeptidase